MANIKKRINMKRGRGKKKHSDDDYVYSEDMDLEEEIDVKLPKSTV